MVKPLPKDHLRHAAVERLRFIDARLFWEARINRADLIEVFAISPAQAALDFREYLATAGMPNTGGMAPYASRVASTDSR